MREFPLDTAYADYLLFVDHKAVGIVEAKVEGAPLAGVAEKASMYAFGLPALEYFDASLIGLTATPSKQTFGFFNQNLVMEYSRRQRWEQLEETLVM